MTFDLTLNDYSIEKTAYSRFKSVFDKEEYDSVVKLCKRVFNKDFSNNSGVRFERYVKKENKIVLSVSEVCFYDFLTSTFTLYNFEKLFMMANENERRIISKIKNRMEIDGLVIGLPDLLSRHYLSNSLAVSCLIQDKQGRFLITKRNNKVGIANCFYSTSVTGAIDKKDFLSNNPLVNCCIREIQEELGYSIQSSIVHIYAIVAGEKKLQPIALANIMIDSIDDIITILKDYEDFSKESSESFIATQTQIKDLLLDKNAFFTEAARTHLRGVVE